MEKKYVISIILGILVLLSIIFMVLLIFSNSDEDLFSYIVSFYNLETEDVLFNPIAIAFFILLIFSFFSLFFLKKYEIATLIISAFIILYWEIFVETLGWYFDLWAFAEGETNVIHVLRLGLYHAITVYPFFLFIGGIFLFFLRIKKDNLRKIIIVSYFIGFSLYSWTIDIIFLKYDSYLITFIVWSILNSSFFLAIYYIKKYLEKQKEIFRFIK